jgi:hypothetical protein
MRTNWWIGGVMCILLLVLNASICNAKTLNFAGRTWVIRANGNGGPGPNNWSENNAWIDSSGQLHLKISKSNDKWYCAEVYTTESLSFGKYQWFVIGRVDKFDKNVVLGLFPYLGPAGQNEIDIEIAKWGHPTANMGSFNVWPAKKGFRNNKQQFAVDLNGDYTTHRFNWQSESVFFQMLNGHRNDDLYEISNWLFKPVRYLDYIPQTSMPVHMNLWLFKGLAPSDDMEVEIIIKSFQYSK